MRLGSPLDALSSALAHAAYVALEPVQHFRRDFTVVMSPEERRARQQREHVEGVEAAWPGTHVVLRPRIEDIEVYAQFSQLWGSTALGFGGIGGAAMTPAYTTVLLGPRRDVAVYFAGRFAYRLGPGLKQDLWERFEDDLKCRNLVEVNEAVQRYGATGIYEAVIDDEAQAAAAPSAPRRRKPLSSTRPWSTRPSFWVAPANRRAGFAMVTRSVMKGRAAPTPGTRS